MPVPDNQRFTVEIDLAGTIAAAGSGAYFTTTHFRFRRTNGVPVLSKADIAGTFQTHLVTEFVTCLNASYTLDHIRVRFMEDPADPFLDVVPVGAPIVGQNAGDRMPPDNVAFILKKTAFRGKHYRGGMWLSPMSELDTSAVFGADRWTGGAQARLDNLAAKIALSFTDTAGNVWLPIVAQMSLIDDSVIPHIIPFSQITQAIARKSVGRFKRRAPKSVY